ncbi:hypothetical protein EV385_6597 [Krasilnikovia cinnamomea]|uniref:Uncharacterized protein n=2 Tax=Krasilnikovia cinnamomea TaxID=349313 RepID=A0A4Q7Z9J0_9ACTN|nr:hypothetical protein EV385_6597 [Krasilnikovia cinnamomea]
MPLPTRDQMIGNALQEINRAYAALGDAADWLRSDWQPAGSSLTDAQAETRDRLQTAITEAKAAINRAKR